ncbi:MAG: GAF domain-containing protein [Bdellovibrio sp.]|nr:GAF domain-containing protein [Bdellovibrio sp.]
MQTQTLKNNFTQKETLQELKAILTGRWVTDLSNTAALLNSRFNDINWLGFYLADEKETLWLGPFQGLPACATIPFSKGVCGAAATQKKSMRIADVDQFPGHVVCDSRSRSEVVVPMIVDNKVIGVLDVDSASLNRFSAEDQIFFEKAVQILLNIYFLNEKEGQQINAAFFFN